MRALFHELRAHRSAAIVHRAVQRAAHGAVRCAHDRREAIFALAQVDAAPAAHRDGLRIVGRRAVEIERAHRRAVQRQFHLVARVVRDRDLHARDRRVEIGARPQPPDAGFQFLEGEVWHAREARAVAAGGGGLGRARRWRQMRGDRAGRGTLRQGRGTLAGGEHEVRAPQRAAAHVDELRVAAPGMPRRCLAVRGLMAPRQRDGVELHDMRAGQHVLEVILAVFVRDRIAAVLEVDAHVGDARQFPRFLAAVARDHAAHHDRALAEELLAQLDHRLRGVRGGARVGDGLRAVLELGAARPDRDLDDVAQRHGRAGGDGADRPGERAAVGAHRGIRAGYVAETRRSGPIAHASRQVVDDPHAGERTGRADIAHADRVLHEVPRGGDRRRGGLLDEEGAARGIEGHVDVGGRGPAHREIQPVGARADRIRRTRQGLDLRVRRIRREGVANGRDHFEPVVAACHEREAEYAVGKIVDRATGIGDRLARDDFRRIGADAVVAEYLRRRAARGHEPNARAVHGGARARIEHEPEGVDERRGARRIGRVEAVDIARGEGGVAFDFEHAVTGVRCRGPGLDVADELAAVRRRLGEAHPLPIATGRGHVEIDGVDRRGIEVLVCVPQAQEQCLATVDRGGRRERHGLRRVDGGAVRSQRRRQADQASRADALRGRRARLRCLRVRAQQGEGGAARRRDDHQVGGVREDALGCPARAEELHRGDVADHRAGWRLRKDLRPACRAEREGEYEACARGEAPPKRRRGRPAFRRPAPGCRRSIALQARQDHLVVRLPVLS